MWKWKLSMENRVALGTLLRQCKGGYAELKLIDKLMEDVISKEERKAFNLRAEGGMILWNTVGPDNKALALDKEVEFGPEGRMLITRNLMMLNEANELERMYMGIYKLFCMTPWPDPQK